MLNNEVINLGIILVGALIGALKLSIETRCNKNCLSSFIDTLLGWFTGSLLGFHFGAENNIYISGLIALSGGAVGALAISSIIEIFPSIFKKVLKNIVINK